MESLKQKYKTLKTQLTKNVGFELSEDELMWNEGVFIAIETLFKNVPENIVKLVKLNHI